MELEKACESTRNQGCLGILETKKTALADLLDFKVEYVLFWSRIQNIAEMDLPTSFYFGLERKHLRAKS